MDRRIALASVLALPTIVPASMVAGQAPVRFTGPANAVAGVKPRGFESSLRGLSAIERRVSVGHAATTSRASDPQVFVEWLTSTGYAPSRSVNRRIAPYVRRKWYFAEYRGTTGPVYLAVATEAPSESCATLSQNRDLESLSLHSVAP